MITSINIQQVGLLILSFWIQTSTKMFYSGHATVFAIILLSQYVALENDFISHITREKCIDELGCFDANAPFFDIVERPISLLPDEREDINTKFLLYTPNNPKTPSTFSNIHGGNVKDISKTSFNPRAGVKFIVPGYISRTAPEWKEPLIEALLQIGESNVFLVDWTGGDGLLYEQAVANTRVVGAEIALFIKRLQDFTGVEPQSVHIIGHSLGSHIAGYAGKRVKSLGRITAMDPAGPYFTGVDPVVRLDRADAQLVDAIHTNAAQSRFQGFGLTESIGHFDFYPNGGQLQPGCKDMGHAILSFLSHPSFDAKGLREIQCNHKRAIELFISSIRRNECELLGTPCENLEKFLSGECGDCSNHSTDSENCIPLGIHIDQYVSKIRKNASLNLFLNTTATEPYCT